MAIFYLLWVWAGFSSADLGIEKKGLLTLAMLYNLSSAFFFTRYDFDLRHPKLMGKKDSDCLHQVFVLGNFAVSSIVPIMFIVGMAPTTELMFLLLTGQLMTTCCSLHAATLLLDSQVLKILKERKPEPGIVQGLISPPAKSKPIDNGFCCSR